MYMNKHALTAAYRYISVITHLLNVYIQLNA